jgi:hypothetical protein
MMMLAPANGKIMINPVCYTNGGDSYSHALNSSPNIKNANFVITDTADKSIKLRLANSGDGERRGTGGSRVLPKFAWVGLDFYDNNTPFLTIPVPGVSDVAASIANPADVSSGVTLTPLNDAIPFYPNSWLDCTIYLKNSAAESIDSTLLFGNYNRIHTYATLDYYSWANYITYHWGYQNNNYNLMQRIGFKTSSTTNYAKDKSGYQYPPTYWGDNFSMYLLDGAYTNEQAWLMQGVTIGNTAKADGSASGVVYATRGLKIGGSLTIKAGNQTFEGVYTTLDGFDGNLGSGIYSTSQVYQPTYHQAITNTNLIFGAAANKTVSHEILHPDSIHGYEGRTLSILGGNIYVGGSSAENARSILTIDSEVKDGIKVDGQVEADGVTVTPINSGYRNIIAYTENGNRMYIQPNEMIVGDGGTIIVRGNANDHDNVNPGIIYVQSGGTLTLENGAKVLTSKIVVDAGGTLNIQGSARVMATIVIKHGGKLVISGGATIIGDVLVRGDMSLGGTLTVNLPQPMPLDNPDTVWSEADPRYHGVFIFNGTILGSGTLSVSGAPFVQGTSGKIHNMVNSQGFPPPLITDAQAANIFCTDPDPEPVTNICRHFSTGNSIWILASTEGG